MGSAVASATASLPRSPGLRAATASMAGEASTPIAPRCAVQRPVPQPMSMARRGCESRQSTAAARAVPAPRWAKAWSQVSAQSCVALGARKPGWPRPSQALQARLAQAHQLLRQAQLGGIIVCAQRVAPTAQRLAAAPGPSAAGGCPAWSASANSSRFRNRGCGASRAARATAIAGRCGSGTGTSDRVIHSSGVRGKRDLHAAVRARALRRGDVGLHHDFDVAGSPS